MKRYFNAIENDDSSQNVDLTPLIDMVFILRTGWFPLILGVYSNKKLIGASYLYLKNNSYGEYIFDWAWADAWKRNGLQYYPKLVGAVPFTPATGPKVLCADENDKPKAEELSAKWAWVKASKTL